MEREVETVIWINGNLYNDRRHNQKFPGELIAGRNQPVVVPEGHRVGGASGEAYDAYRTGLDSACADIVVTTTLPSGEHAVVASKPGVSLRLIQQPRGELPRAAARHDARDHRDRRAAAHSGDGKCPGYIG